MVWFERSVELPDHTRHCRLYSTRGNVFFFFNQTIHLAIQFCVPRALIRICAMPLGNKRSRCARQKRQHGHTAFTKHAGRPPSPGGSDYAMDINSDTSTTEPESNSESKTDNQEAASVEGIKGLQCLYAVFLPPHLRKMVKTREKRRKVTNRGPVYTGDSRTTTWQFQKRT
jgi:hypothetical protein